MMNNMIKIEDFGSCDIRIGTILSAEIVENADTLVVFQIDLGETETTEDGEVVSKPRQILSGVRKYFEDISSFVGLQVPVLANLPTRKMRGLESQGMILYVVGEGEDFTTLSPAHKVTNGTKIS